MKNLSTSLFFVLLALATTISASAQTIRRVSASVTGTNIYADFATAQTAAAAGDIIQIEPGAYGFNIDLNKSVTVVGPGYFLGSALNPNLQANSQSATVNTIIYNTGSSGASVAGITASVVYFGANNVTLQRCYITNVVYLNYTNTLITNINIRQNYIASLQHNQSAGATNLLMTNNIFVNYVTLNTNDGGEFRGNVMMDQSNYSPTLFNCNVVNNYFGYQYSAPAFTNCTVTYNAFLFAYPTAGNNQNNVAKTAVFTLAPGTTPFDAWFQLKTGTNVLRTTGENGVDIGAFAGNSPYKLGGLPTIPAIYQLSNSVSGNTLNVNLSTRSNN